MTNGVTKTYTLEMSFDCNLRGVMQWDILDNGNSMGPGARTYNLEPASNFEMKIKGTGLSQKKLTGYLTVVFTPVEGVNPRPLSVDGTPVEPIDLTNFEVSDLVENTYKDIPPKSRNAGSGWLLRKIPREENYREYKLSAAILYDGENYEFDPRLVVGPNH